MIQYIKATEITTLQHHLSNHDKRRNAVLGQDNDEWTMNVILYCGFYFTLHLLWLNFWMHQLFHIINVFRQYLLWATVSLFLSLHLLKIDYSRGVGQLCGSYASLDSDSSVSMEGIVLRSDNQRSMLCHRWPPTVYRVLFFTKLYRLKDHHVISLMSTSSYSG